MNVNLNLYKYFYEVAKQKSYTRAAENLFVSQPSLSYSVKVLEEQLGYKLFYKEKNTLNLTKEGQEVFDKLVPLFKSFDEISTLSLAERKNVKIGVRSAYGSYVLPNYIYEFNKIFPEYLVEYQIGTSAELIGRLKKRELDFIIDEYKYNDMNSKLIKSFDVVFFSSSNNPIEEITKDNIKDYTVLIQETNNFSKKIKNQYNFNYKVVKKTPLMIVEVSKSNLIGISTEKLLKDPLESGKIKILKSKIDLPKSELYIISNKDFDIFNNEFSKFIIENSI